MKNSVFGLRLALVSNESSKRVKTAGFDKFDGTKRRFVLECQ